MKKEELQVLGIPDETIREVQKIHGRDMEKLKARLGSTSETIRLNREREAVIAMVKLVNSPDNLDRILTYVNRAYYAEQREAAQAERDREQSNEEEQK